MNALIRNLLDAQEHAVSIKPVIGGFPVLAEILKQAGVKMNRWTLPSCQAIYVMNSGTVIQQGTPLVTGTVEVPKFNREALVAAIRTDKEGKSTFHEFLLSAWMAGVVNYETDFVNRKIIYFGVDGESYLEEYLPVEI